MYRVGVRVCVCVYTHWVSLCVDEVNMCVSVVKFHPTLKRFINILLFNIFSNLCIL